MDSISTPSPSASSTNTEQMAANPKADEKIAAAKPASDSTSAKPSAASSKPASEAGASKPTPSQPADELLAARQKMEEKLERKRVLIAKLKELNASMDELHAKLEVLRPQMKSGAMAAAERLADRAEKLEFSISTSAYTPAQERELLKGLKEVQDKLAAAKAGSAAMGEADGLREKIRSIGAERAALRNELDAMRAELESLYQTILKLGASRHAEREARERGRQEYRAKVEDRQTRGREWKGRNEERRKAEAEERADMAPFLKDSHDPHVSLEEIVEIKKKPKAPSSE